MRTSKHRRRWCAMGVHAQHVVEEDVIREVELANQKPQVIEPINTDGCLMEWSDGGHRFPGSYAGGWLLKYWVPDQFSPVKVKTKASFYAEAEVDRFIAEARAMLEIVQYVVVLISKREP